MLPSCFQLGSVLGNNVFDNTIGNVHGWDDVYPAQNQFGGLDPLNQSALRELQRNNELLSHNTQAHYLSHLHHLQQQLMSQGNPPSSHVSPTNQPPVTQPSSTSTPEVPTTTTVHPPPPSSSGVDTTELLNQVKQTVKESLAEAKATPPMPMPSPPLPPPATDPPPSVFRVPSPPISACGFHGVHSIMCFHFVRSACWQSPQCNQCLCVLRPYQKPQFKVCSTCRPSPSCAFSFCTSEQVSLCIPPISHHHRSQCLCVPVCAIHPPAIHRCNQCLCV